MTDVRRGRQPSWAVAWSGGKDSTLALHRWRQRGERVTHLFNLHEADSGRVRFHGVRCELIEAQARSLDCKLVQEATGPEEFETHFQLGLARLKEAGIHGLVFGNIHLADVREWYESRVRAAGLEHREPLWGENSAALVREFLGAGYRTRIVSVNLGLGAVRWLGEELSARLVAELEQAGGVDPAGERGEYHTFCWDGPTFREPVRTRTAGTFEREGHRILDLAR